MLAGARRFCRYQVDSGWAWVVCIASFFVQAVIFGTIQSFGTLFISLLNDFKSGESATAWVGSLGYGFLFVIGPITTALCEHFGCRVMACAGSVLTTFSLLVTSFAPSISTMYFTFGVLWGTGGSFLFFSGLLILRFYFSRNLSLANGITMTGAGFGTLVFNVMLQELDDKYGWRGGMRVLSVFSALTFLCGCAYIPPPVEFLPFERRSLTSRLKTLIDPRPWRDRAFPMWLLSLSFILFAYFFPYTYLVRMALTLGIPVSQGALLLGYLSISAIFGKLLSGRLADLPRVRRLYIFVISATVLSVSSMCVTAAKSYHGLLAYTLVAGFFDGCFVVTVPLITQDIVGKELMAKAIGIQYGLVAFPLTLGPPVLGELYKSTNSFTTAFFVSSCSVLVGVGLVYIVQRIRPDLTHKEERGSREVYDPSPSIHSASVVDTLSGMFITEPGLSLSNLDPVEISSYQRFDSFRREDLRATLFEPFQGQGASKTEMEAVYRQAVDNLSNSGGVTTHQRNRSDTSGISNANFSTQSRSGSVFAGSMLSSSEMQGNLDSPSGLQIPVGETNDSPKSDKSAATLVDANIEESCHEEDCINIPDEGTTLQEGDYLEKLSVASVNYRTTVSPTSDVQTVLDAGGIEKSNSDVSDIFASIQPLQVELENREVISPEPIISDDVDIELEVELVKLPPPPESHRKRRIGLLDIAAEEQNDAGSILSAVDDDIKSAFIPTTKGAEGDGKALTCSEESMVTPLVEDSLAEKEGDAEVLELVRIPPPPTIPRTGQLVALEAESNEGQRNASISEIKLDTDQCELYENEVANEDFPSKETPLTQRKERLHLAIIDQLNVLSERLEAVAARQIKEEENGEDDQPDQRPVFSPALQSLPLTPLYSANHSVPLTPVRAWSSSLNTPAPTPHQTPPSAFLTTAPTPIHTPRTPSQSVSGICTPSEVSVANPSRSNVCGTSQVNDHDSNSWVDVTEICSPSPSQESTSRHRSRCSSFSELGQELVLSEWSLRDLRGSAEGFSSKMSSGTNSSVSNSARSLGDLHNVSEPIDVVGVMTNESHGGHMNSPENFIIGQQLEPPAMCLPEIPYLQFEGMDAARQNPFQQHSDLTKLQTDQVDDSFQAEAMNTSQLLEQEVPKEEHFTNEVKSPQETYQNFNTTDPNLNERESAGTMDIKSDSVFNCCQSESITIPQPEECSNSSNPTESRQILEFKLDSSEVQPTQICCDQSSLEVTANPFLETDQKEFQEIFQHNPFQQSAGGIPVQSQNPFQIPGGSLTQQEQLLTACQQTGVSISQDQFISEHTDTISPESKCLSQISPKLNTSPKEVDSHGQHYCTENLVDKHPVLHQQIDLTLSPEKAAETSLAGHTLLASDNMKENTYQQLSAQSKWTMFSPSEEGLIFEMDTESESSSDNSAKLENTSARTSLEAKNESHDSCTADQESLFPPLQMFSDIVDITMTANDQGIPLKLPPPPRQVHRKRTDTSVSTSKENSYPLKIGGKGCERKQTPIVDNTNVDKEEGLPPETKKVDEHEGDIKLGERVANESTSVEAHPVLSGGDLSITGNSVSEIESDLLTESKLDDLTYKQSDNSISGIVCQEFESIQNENGTFTCAEGEDSNVDEDLVKTSFHDDIAPLLVQNDGQIQYVNLRDLPQDCHVLQKRASTTSSTDDSSASTDSSSSLSENEMPYNKLHEDSYTSDQG